jgi:hypothetical protein
MIAVQMADNPALLDPYTALTPSERTLLRKLDNLGPALSAGYGHGWMLGGTRYTAKAMKRFLDKQLAIFWKDPVDGHVKLQLNYAGRLVAERIAFRHTKPGLDDLPDD